MDIRTALKQATIQLQPTSIQCADDSDLGHLEAEVLLADIVQRDKVWLLSHDDTALMPAQARRFTSLVRRRAKHEPMAQILGYKDFYGRRLRVDKHVLIPRPETELLIEEALKAADATGNKTVFWDVGTGSGAIAVTLACERMKADVLASDVSLRALAVAKKNATSLKVKPRITFMRSNLLQKPAYLFLNKHTKTHEHLIVCANLPYLPTSDVDKLAPDVIKHEPHRALFSGADGLGLIKRLLGQLARHIPEWKYKRVTLLFEFDPPQSDELVEIAETLFKYAKIEIKKDLAGRDRLLKVSI